jgi:hypothetical protein
MPRQKIIVQASADTPLLKTPAVLKKNAEMISNQIPKTRSPDVTGRSPVRLPMIVSAIEQIMNNLTSGDEEKVAASSHYGEWRGCNMVPLHPVASPGRFTRSRHPVASPSRFTQPIHPGATAITATASSSQCS